MKGLNIFIMVSPNQKAEKAEKVKEKKKTVLSEALSGNTEGAVIRQLKKIEAALPKTAHAGGG